MELKILSQDQITAAPKSGCSAGSCGSSGDQLAHLPEDIRRRVHNHPCYSEQAHHYYARMHVAVAPACNIQCHYCNRKYDCANESRPGVVSELLTPEQAVKKALAVAANIPQMTVLGIAGPGDPLANPERTFATFRMLSERAPDIKLCVSTNGLMLPEYMDELLRHKIDHVTVTINCVDPEVGAAIYPWIFWNHRRIKGRKGVQILIEQQQKGLEMLVQRGVLVKVNSVLIPGVNDGHLKEVSRIVKDKGAFLHNVMPLIAEAGHGTFYGVMGQRGPTHAELKTLQDDCAGDMNMMRHCRQCRADAVGLLGEDRNAEFTLDKIESMEIDYQAAMETRARVRAAIADELAESLDARAKYRPVTMAVATTGGGIINQHFGHARTFLLYEASPDGIRFIGHRETGRYCLGGDDCGENESLLTETLRALEGCEAVLCSMIGLGPWEALEEAGIQPHGEYAMESIEDAVMAVYQEMIDNGKLDGDTAAQVKASA
ncbi:MAG TPA: nitrogenase cofactor biosynthesis protein NifB [Gammaproteobacteria bacterium]|nr:nitrogenase cofactor biosynthesis protein NifB [Gammaproteobacteria bacterium]